MRYAEHTARTGRGEIYTGFCGKTWVKETTWKI